MEFGRRPLRREDWLTQLGPKCYNQPKEGQIDVSLWLGRLPVERMVEIVGGPGRRLKKRDEVRHFKVGCLQDAGFVLEADNELVNGEQHVSVRVPGEWTTDYAARFEACVERGAGVRDDG
jgi:hypothetical protein